MLGTAIRTPAPNKRFDRSRRSAVLMVPPVQFGGPVNRGVKRTRGYRGWNNGSEFEIGKRVVGVRHAVKRASSNNHMQRSAVIWPQMDFTSRSSLYQRAR
jgi:hypothetical protein